MSQRTLLVSQIAWVPLVAACTYGADVAKAPETSDSPVRSDAGALGEKAEGSADPMRSDAASGPTTGVGSISFVVSRANSEKTTSEIVADFQSAPGGWNTSSPPCTYRTDGTCSIAVCPVMTTPTEGEPHLVSAGPITVSGYPTPLDPGDGGASLPWAETYNASVPGALWTGGEAISISAAGAAVPPFSGSVPFPATLQVTTPTVTTVSLSAGLSIAWKPSVNTVLVAVSQWPTPLIAGSTNVTIECTVAPPSSGFALTPSQLSDLATGGIGETNDYFTTIWFDTENETLVNAGSYAVTLSASTNAPTIFQPSEITP
jgi:hypothetical protein